MLTSALLTELSPQAGLGAFNVGESDLKQRWVLCALQCGITDWLDPEANLDRPMGVGAESVRRCLDRHRCLTLTFTGENEGTSLGMSGSPCCQLL